MVLPIGRRGAERVRLARARLIHRRGRVGARPPALRATAAVRGTEAHAGVYLAGEQRTGSIPGEHPINFTSYYSTPLYYTYTKNLRICFALHLADYCLGDTKKKKRRQWDREQHPTTKCGCSGSGARCSGSARARGSCTASSRATRRRSGSSTG